MGMSKIWCEVTCGRCQRVANNCGYYSADLIKRLRAETKDWKHDDCYRITCPQCTSEVLANRKREHKFKSAADFAESIGFQREEIEHSLDESLF